MCKIIEVMSSTTTKNFKDLSCLCIIRAKVKGCGKDSYSIMDFRGVAKWKKGDYCDLAAGSAIAEAKANRAVIKYQIQLKKEELAPYLDMYSRMKSYKNFNEKSCEAYAVRKQIKIREKEITNYKKQIEVLEDSIRWLSENSNKTK